MEDRLMKVFFVIMPLLITTIAALMFLLGMKESEIMRLEDECCICVSDEKQD